MTLHLPDHLRTAVIEHCRTQHPLEACGVLAGRDDRPLRHIPLPNMAGSTSRFEVSPDAQLAAWQAMDAAGEDPIVVYHSHTSSAPIPSRRDIVAAADPAVHYLIVSTRDWAMTSWRLYEGALLEEEVQVVGAVGDVGGGGGGSVRGGRVGVVDDPQAVTR